MNKLTLTSREHEILEHLCTYGSALLRYRTESGMQRRAQHVLETAMIGVTVQEIEKIKSKLAG